MLLSGVVLQPQCARQRLCPQAPHKYGTSCTTTVRLRGGATQHRPPDRVSASVCGSVCTCPAHLQRHALWDWRADNTWATTTTQSVGELLTTARRPWLYESCSYRPRHRYASPRAPGRCNPASSAGHGITHYFSEGRGNAVSCR